MKTLHNENPCGKILQLYFERKKKENPETVGVFQNSSHHWKYNKALPHPSPQAVLLCPLPCFFQMTFWISRDKQLISTVRKKATEEQNLSLDEKQRLNCR